MFDKYCKHDNWIIKQRIQTIGESVNQFNRQCSTIRALRMVKHATDFCFATDCIELNGNYK